jgi:3-hydroxyacyl-CoA dehydrogenase
MNSARLNHDAKSEVLRLAEAGYVPPVRRQLSVFGETAAAQLKLGIFLMKEAGNITEYEAHLGNKLVYILCGGDVTRPSVAPEQYFLDLEREAFKSLCGEPKTLARMEHLLKKGKVLRN